MKVLYTDESPFLYCAATASSFSWKIDGSSIESSTSYNTDFHVGQTGSYVYGLTQSWKSSLQMAVQTKNDCVWYYYYHYPVRGHQC